MMFGRPVAIVVSMRNRFVIKLENIPVRSAIVRNSMQSMAILPVAKHWCATPNSLVLPIENMSSLRHWGNFIWNPLPIEWFELIVEAWDGKAQSSRRCSADTLDDRVFVFRKLSVAVAMLGHPDLILLVSSIVILLHHHHPCYCSF